MYLDRNIAHKRKLQWLQPQILKADSFHSRRLHQTNVQAFRRDAHAYEVFLGCYCENGGLKVGTEIALPAACFD